MRVIVQTVNQDGTVTNTNQPWTADELLAVIADIRYGKESGGIVVGDQPVSTFRDEMPIWLGMMLDMQGPSPQEQYEYKPRGGVNVVLEPWQVARCYQCFAWYTAACFAVERYLRGLVDATPNDAQALETIYQTAISDQYWPQTSFAWMVQQPVAAFQPEPLGDLS